MKMESRKSRGNSAFAALVGAVSLLFVGGGVAVPLNAGDPLISFPVEAFVGSDTVVSVPVRHQPDYRVEVAGVSGQRIDLLEALDADVSGTHAIAVATGPARGLRGRIEGSGAHHVVIESGVHIGDIETGDMVEIVPGWTFENLFEEHSFPNGVQILLFERVKRGIDVAASSVFEYDASEDAWYDLARQTLANGTVIHESETFVVRDTRPSGENPENFSFVMTGFGFNRVPRVDLGVKEENAPQDVRFGVPFPVTLGDSGLGEHMDTLLLLDPMDGGVVRSATYFDGFGWFDGGASAEEIELERGAVYVYRKAAPESSDFEPVSTVSLVIRGEIFGDHQGDPAPRGSVFGIVVDTEDEGFFPPDYMPLPPFTSAGDETSIFLRGPDGEVTGNKLVFHGTVPVAGSVGGAFNVRLSTGAGGVNPGDPWAIVWFPAARAGETPRIWDGFGFLNTGRTIPFEGRTVEYDFSSEANEINTPDFVPLGKFSTYESWLVHFDEDERQDPAFADPEGDPGGYGVPNLARYALNLDPRRPDLSELPEVTAGIPDGLDEEYLTIRYTRYIDAEDIAVFVEASSDLEQWEALGDTLIVETGAAERRRTETVTVRDADPLSEHRERFLRVKVEWSED